MKPLTIAAPEKPRKRLRVHPVFLPFQGCPARCVFCAQTLQTGQLPLSLDAALSRLDAGLAALTARGAAPRELAFYGGTFTLLPRSVQFACLDLAAAYRARGLITAVRASTRPDALDPEHLAVLRERGLTMLELGVQSFADIPLAASARGYGGETAKQACRAVRDAGLELGVQLMPGMPGMLEGDFRRDMDMAVALAPDVLRLYPCLVLAGTGLEAVFRRGEYVPWPLDAVIPLLADAQLRAWDAGIAVIRIGLAAQKELDGGGIVAGPAHPALGSMVRGLALFWYIEREMNASNVTVKSLAIPRRHQGEFWGHSGALKGDYARFGITPENVVWHNGDTIEIVPRPRVPLPQPQ